MCPEFDIMEANKYAWRTTAHKCTSSQDSLDYYYYSKCDGAGKCVTDVLLDAPQGAYAPGSTSGIDTNLPFHVKQEFHETDNLFSGHTTTFTQEGR